MQTNRATVERALYDRVERIGHIDRRYHRRCYECGGDSLVPFADTEGAPALCVNCEVLHAGGSTRCQSRSESSAPSRRGELRHPPRSPNGRESIRAPGRCDQPFKALARPSPRNPRAPRAKPGARDVHMTTLSAHQTLTALPRAERRRCGSPSWRRRGSRCHRPAMEGSRRWSHSFARNWSRAGTTSRCSPRRARGQRLGCTRH